MMMMNNKITILKNTNAIINIKGMFGPKIDHFYNNLFNIIDTKIFIKKLFIYYLQINNTII